MPRTKTVTGGVRTWRWACDLTHRAVHMPGESGWCPEGWHRLRLYAAHSHRAPGSGRQSVRWVTRAGLAPEELEKHFDARELVASGELELAVLVLRELRLDQAADLVEMIRQQRSGGGQEVRHAQRAG